MLLSPGFCVSAEFTPLNNGADDNPSASLGAGRMPIRRVMVNWGDGSPITNQNKKGLYKNRKPFCANADDYEPIVTDQNKIGWRCFTSLGANIKDSYLTCKTDDDCKWISGTCQPADNRKFGDALRACEQNYFEFTHNYDCSNTSNQVPVSSLDAETKTRLYGMGLKDTDKVCVYTPKVQVLDNWGWCNGECPGGVDDSNGCYDGEGQIGGTDECNPDSDYNSWTEYKGKIIVVPT